MAKSIRSKHRRRMRSIKRASFAKKNLEKLKTTLMRDSVNNLANNIEMSDIAEIARPIKKGKTAAEISAENAKNAPVKTTTEVSDENTDGQDNVMEVEGGSKTYDKKKKTDEHGQYPMWMNQRAIRKQQKKNKKVKRQKGKKSSAW